MFCIKTVFFKIRIVCFRQGFEKGGKSAFLGFPTWWFFSVITGFFLFYLKVIWEKSQNVVDSSEVGHVVRSPGRKRKFAKIIYYLTYFLTKSDMVHRHDFMRFK